MLELAGRSLADVTYRSRALFLPAAAVRDFRGGSAALDLRAYLSRELAELANLERSREEFHREWHRGLRINQTHLGRFEAARRGLEEHGEAATRKLEEIRAELRTLLREAHRIEVEWQVSPRTGAVEILGGFGRTAETLVAPRSGAAIARFFSNSSFPHVLEY